LRLEPPQLAGQLIVVVDRTTPRDPIAWPAFVSSSRKLAARPGQRVVVLAFAGLARGEALSPVLTIDVESRLLESTVVDDLPIAPYRRSQQCVERAAQTSGERIVAALEAMSREPVANDLQHSEIAYSIRKTLADFGGALNSTVIVYSDGFEHSRDGQSFYARAEARSIDPAGELAVLRRRGLGALSSTQLRAPRVLWYGLMALEQKRYFAPADELAYASFWRSALELWGVQDLQLGLTLSNPRL